MVQILSDSSLIEPEVMDVDQSDVVDWRMPIVKYLETGELPGGRVDAHLLQRRAAYYLLRNGLLYERGYFLLLLQCVRPV